MHGQRVVEHVAVPRRLGSVLETLREPAEFLSLVAVVGPQVLPAPRLLDFMGQTVRRTQANRQRQQIMGSLAVLPAQLKRRHARRITEEGKVDQFIHCLEIEPGLLGLGIQVQVAGVDLGNGCVDPALRLSQFLLGVADRIEILRECCLVTRRKLST